MSMEGFASSGSRTTYDLRRTMIYRQPKAAD